MAVLICDRCGDVTLTGAHCRCATPYDPIEVRRRYRRAVTRARATDASIRRTDVAPRAA